MDSIMKIKAVKNFNLARISSLGILWKVVIAIDVLFLLDMLLNYSKITAKLLLFILGV